MGRTVPSWRIAAYQEVKRWSNFRSALDKKERKSFDDMMTIHQLYNCSCGVACRPIRIQPTLMAILLHHFKQLSLLVNQVESNLKG